MRIFAPSPSNTRWTATWCWRPIFSGTAKSAPISATKARIAKKAWLCCNAPDVSQAVADIGAASRALRSLLEPPGKTAVLGYCFGGLLAYLSAAQGGFDAAVAYYGGHI